MEIGYLPAEHIETPTERLARLNKHRNIDLAANMLSDTVHEKSRNPLKKAMRRRNAKTVQFTDPIYHEASEYEYSSEEEGEEGAEAEGGDGNGNVEVHDDADEAEASGKQATGPVKRDSGEKDRAARPTVSVVRPPGSEARAAEAAVKRESEDSAKLRPSPTPTAIRHPDSAIFRDENTGTKKLTLTPNLLRDDDIVVTPTKPEVIKGRVSLDREGRLQPNRAEDVISPSTTHKPTTRLRKGSVLGNLFKRGRRGRKDEEGVEEWLAQATSGSGSNQEKQSIDSSRSASQDSPNGRGEETRKEREDAQVREERRRQHERQRQQRERESKGTQAAATTAGTIRRVDPETKRAQSPVSEPRQRQQQAGPSGTAPVETRRPEREQLTLRTDQTRDGPSPVTSPNEINSQHQTHQPYRQRLSEDSKPAQSPQHYQSAQRDCNQERGRAVDRLSESPEQITFHDAAERPDLLVDTSSGAESNDTPSPINSTPEMIDRSSTSDTTTTSPVTGAEHNHTIARTWSDWSLRTYFEDDNDVRDMLIVVQQDKGDVPQQKQHPQIAPLFAEPSRRLEDITKVCPSLLRRWCLAC